MAENGQTKQKTTKTRLAEADKLVLSILLASLGIGMFLLMVGFIMQHMNPGVL